MAAGESGSFYFNSSYSGYFSTGSRSYSAPGSYSNPIPLGDVQINGYKLTIAGLFNVATDGVIQFSVTERIWGLL